MLAIALGKPPKKLKEALSIREKARRSERVLEESCFRGATF
jgi:hypothetical protein